MVKRHEPRDRFARRVSVKDGAAALRWTSALGLAAVLGLAACSKPAPPTITSVRPTSIGVTAIGLTVGLELGMQNPNAVPIPLESVQAHVVLDGTLDLGTATVPDEVILAAGQETRTPVSVELPWKDMRQLAHLVASGRDVDYKADGTVALGGKLLNVSVPFVMAGTITREDLARGAMQGLPRLFPK
jgi:LEA14-like dessication related protein